VRNALQLSLRQSCYSTWLMSLIHDLYETLCETCMRPCHAFTRVSLLCFHGRSTPVVDRSRLSIPSVLDRCRSAHVLTVSVDRRCRSAEICICQCVCLCEQPRSSCYRIISELDGISVVGRSAISGNPSSIRHVIVARSVGIHHQLDM